MTKVGIIGGTGLYELDGLSNVQEQTPDTPFGPPSSPIITAELGDTPVVFLARHGKSHELLPSEVPYRANIYALKQAGARSILTVNAVGSLREELEPGDIVCPRQFIDLTKGIREHTFFGAGLSAHISSADPVCSELHQTLPKASSRIGITVKNEATYICVEGPRLGTRAESHMLRGFGGDIVGMTAIPEVFLAREASLCYSSLCVVTDYDCWKEGLSTDTFDVLENYKKSMDKVKQLLSVVIQEGLALRDCECANALDRALLGDPGSHSAEQQELLAFLRS